MKHLVVVYAAVILLLALTNSSSQTVYSEGTDDTIKTTSNNKKQYSDDTTTSSANKNKTDQITNNYDDIQASAKSIEAERLREQAEQRRMRRQKEREREADMATKNLIKDSSSEGCDWKTQPLAFIRGDACGSYYKILGLNRKKNVVDKNDIKKAYRAKSLAFHPDKNPSEHASAAFKLVQDAYECLSVDACRADYDYKLQRAEEQTALVREQAKDRVVEAALDGLNRVHYYLSVAANYVYQNGMDLWNMAGDFEMELFGEVRPVGQYLMLGSLVWKGRLLLQVYAFSYAVLRMNYELAKSRNLF